MLPYLILLIGLFLIFLEFFLPGAVLGILGGVAVVAAVINYAMNTASPIYALLFFLLAVAAVYFTIKFAIWKVKNATKDFSVYSEDNQEGYVASSFDKASIGKVGVVMTDLKPGGQVLVDGKRQTAISQSGYLVKGTEVIVVGGQEESLIVKEYTKDHER